MGVVYRAEQETPRRVVALKLIKAGRASAAALARFAHEAQVLGRLQHPGIAQIFEGGTADTGFGPQPFFALELIDGVSLTEYADANRLTIRERLTLLIKVCEGVQHAHQMGVIHRDLKPGNILIDKRGQPKILDFGIARATGSDMPPSGSEDGSHQAVGTIPYMSPEQLRGNPADIDTRTDVYALGIIAYQLLSGRLPHDTKAATIQDALRIVTSTQPPRLGRLAKTLRGDVEAIIAKALHTDKTRRYQSIADLAADFRRHLADEPVSARTATVLYRFAKFSIRKRGIAVGLVGALVLLVGGLTTVSVLWRAEVARSKADRAARSQEWLEENWQGVRLIWRTALLDAGSDMTVLAALDLVAEKVEAGDFDYEPGEGARIRYELGEMYGLLGLYDKAKRHAQGAVDLRTRQFGNDDPLTLKSMSQLAYFLMEESKLLNKRDSLYKAESLYRETLETQEIVLGDENKDTLVTQGNLALTLFRLEEYAEAESLFRRTVRTNREVLGGDHRETLLAMNNLALTLKKLDKLDDAENLYRETIEAQRKYLPRDDRDTLQSIFNLAGLLRSNEKKTEAERLYREVLAGRRGTLGDAHPDTIEVIVLLAQLANDRETYGEAASLYREILEQSREAYAADDPNITSALIRLGMFLTERGDPLEAEPLLREAVQLRQKAFAEGAWQVANVESALGACLTKVKRFEEAESLLLKSQPIYEKELGAGDDYTLRGVRRIVALYEAWGKPDKAADYRRRLPQAP